MMNEFNKRGFVELGICKKVWPPLGLKKFETLSYLPDLDQAQLAKEVEYLLRKGWVPCLEFDVHVMFFFGIFILWGMEMKGKKVTSMKNCILLLIFAGRIRVP